ncbi:unnamed protein product, partial [Mesorhabditis spiculigera]
MTVNYSLAAATAKWTNFFKLLIRWRGSLWKLVIFEYIAWLFWTIALMLLAEFFVLETSLEKPLRDLTHFFQRNDIGTGLSFMLGFITPYCYQRWMDMYVLLEWPDNTAHVFNTCVQEDALTPKEMDKLRNCVARYLILAYIMLMRDVSVKGRKRFPTLEHLTHYGGVITGEEKELLGVGRIGAGDPHYWIPICWIITMVKKFYVSGHEQKKAKKDAKKVKSIMTEKHYKEFIYRLLKYRGDLGDVLSFDFVPMPLAQTQLITFVSTLYAILLTGQVMDMGFIERSFLQQSVWISLFYVSLKLLIYVGWVKSFEVIMNPFGEDDDDFDVSQLVDRHWQLLIRVMLDPVTVPPMTAACLPPAVLPHTLASRALMRERDDDLLLNSMIQEELLAQGQLPHDARV